MNDAFTPYETGLARLLERLGNDHPRYAEAQMFQIRLRENLDQVRSFSDSENLRSERNRIMAQLNRLALETVGKGFNDFCRTSDRALIDQESRVLKFWNVLRGYLWRQFVTYWMSLAGITASLIEIFGVPPCPARLALTSLTVLGGGAILGYSLLLRYRDRFQLWDRWLALGLVIISAGLSGWLTYQACTPAIINEINECPTVKLSVSPEKITPGDTAHVTAHVDDPENDQPAFWWAATAAGLQIQGGPYLSPQNEYIAPPGSAGQNVRITVIVDDYHCTHSIKDDTTVHIVSPTTPSETDTPASVVIPAASPIPPSIPTPTFTPTASPTSTPTFTPTFTPTPTVTPKAPPTSTPTFTPTFTPTPDCQVAYLELDLATGLSQKRYPDASNTITLTHDEILQTLSGRAELTGTNVVSCTCSWEGRTTQPHQTTPAPWEKITSLMGKCYFRMDLPSPVQTIHLKLSIGGQLPPKLFTIRVE